MTILPYILFCESPLDTKAVDPDFEDEFKSAKDNGFEVIIFNFEDLINSNNAEKSTRKIKPINVKTSIMYRGWMLTPHQYGLLYENLLAKNYQLINDPVEYQNCHYLPDSLRFIEQHSPKTIFEKLIDAKDLSSIIAKAVVFGDKPVIIKDYVKSEKHDWETACFVAHASDTERLTQTINNFIRLRDKYLNEGIVIREFIELNDLAIHSKSGMPLTEEYRLFFLNKKLLGIYDYWEEGEYKLSKPGTTQFEEIANGIESNFFSMDIARKKNGELIIIELGDGQVSGLPEALEKSVFYEQMKKNILQK